MSENKIVSIETLGGAHDIMLKNVMRMVPEKDRNDVALQRLLAFRLRIDGEGDTRDYLMRKIRDMIQCRFSGPLYEYLKNDTVSRTCAAPAVEPAAGTDPPETA